MEINAKVKRTHYVIIVLCLYPLPTNYISILLNPYKIVRPSFMRGKKKKILK